MFLNSFVTSGFLKRGYSISVVPGAVACKNCHESRLVATNETSSEVFKLIANVIQDLHDDSGKILDTHATILFYAET